jgi:hypothetical protein
MYKCSIEVKIIKSQIQYLSFKILFGGLLLTLWQIECHLSQDHVLPYYYICFKTILYVGWFSPGTPVSSTNKTDRHDITKILLKVALNTINPPTTLPCIRHWWTLFVTTLTTVSLSISQLMKCKIWWILANYATRNHHFLRLQWWTALNLKINYHLKRRVFKTFTLKKFGDNVRA